MGIRHGFTSPSLAIPLMAYTVKQLATLSGVSVRTLHFYDEAALLRPAFVGPNGYRYYEEPQLLRLQQILFYRELGIELKEIKRILDRRRFEIAGALASHRKALLKKFTRTRALIETIDKTIQHLKGTKKMKAEDIFAGFAVAAGRDRFGEQVKLGGEPNDCKVSGRDTHGALCTFEFVGQSGGPRHRHNEQDEWIYVVQGELDVWLGDRQLRVAAGESVFIPRTLEHVWAAANGKPAKIVDVYQPAGRMEDFFRAVGKYNGKPPIHETLSITELHRLFEDHGMELLGPPPSIGG